MAKEHESYVRWLRLQYCALRRYGGCRGTLCVHHHTGARGRSQRSHDRSGIPLCIQHHTDFHGASGPFRGLGKAARREWQDVQVAKLTKRYEALDKPT